VHRRALSLNLSLLVAAAALCGCASAPAPKLTFAELYARPAPALLAPPVPAQAVPALPVVALRPAAPALRSVPARLDWPVAPVAVTSFFGNRQHPITGELQAHQGLDLAAREGQLVSTAGPGTVVRAGWRGGYGLQVEVVHAGGVHTRYGHLSRVLVEPGMVLEPGDVVGLAGNTGLSTGPHLHFELWRAGRALDPLRVLGPSGGSVSGARTREGRRPSGRRPRERPQPSGEAD
jgi:murein DD-endopeptidase MepM/ murein hydrolase activator NlpD